MRHEEVTARHGFPLPASALRLVLALCLALGVWGICAPARAADEAAVIQAMQKRYESLNSFTAGFTQRMLNAASGDVEERSGSIAFRQPGQVRWQTMKPEPELLVVGATEVWNHFPMEETAYKYTAEQVLSSKTVLRFLSGKARLDEDFWVTSQGRDQGWEKLELVPKEAEPEMVQAYLWLDPEHALLQKVQVIDFFGNENTVALSGLVLNPELRDSLFTFTPPAGTDVYDNTQE